jgi:hypothetical protein
MPGAALPDRFTLQPGYPESIRMPARRGMDAMLQKPVHAGHRLAGKTVRLAADGSIEAD